MREEMSYRTNVLIQEASVKLMAIISGMFFMGINRRVVIGENDLAILSPEIFKEWHPTKKGSLTPSDVTNKSSKYIWWQCSKV